MQATPASLIFKAGSFHQLHISSENEEPGSIREKIKEEMKRYRNSMDLSEATADFRTSENTSS